MNKKITLLLTALMVAGSVSANAAVTDSAPPTVDQPVLAPATAPTAATPPAPTADEPTEPAASPEDTALVKACLNADLAEAKIQLQNGAHINALVDGTSAIGGAALTGHFTLVAYLLTKGANPNLFGGNAPNPLTNAVESGNLDVATALIHAGAKVNAGGGYGETPLMRAAFNGNSAMASLLMASGASPNRPNTTGETPLIAAATSGSVSVARLLLAAHANINASNKNGYSPLATAVNASRPQMVSFLLKSGADVDHVTVSGETPLIFAIRNSDLAMAKILLAAKTNVNAKDGYGTTPIMVAAAFAGTQKGLALFNFLMTKNAQVTAANDDGQTPLMFAAAFGAWDAVKTLAMRGSDATATDKIHSSALLYLAGVNPRNLMLGRPPMLKEATTPEDIAIQKAATSKVLTALDAPGSSEAGDALILAAAAGRIGVVQALLDAKVPVDASGDGLIARFTVSGPTVPVDKSVVWPIRPTALMVAASQGRTAIVDELLKNGADKTVAAADGRTAYDIAVASRHFAIAVKVKPADVPDATTASTTATATK
jgi:ankyrin repeat protein